MRLILDLPPATEEGLLAEAERLGATPADVATRALDSRFGTLDVEARIARLSAALASLPRCEAPLPDEAVGRASFYRE